MLSFTGNTDPKMHFENEEASDDGETKQGSVDLIAGGRSNCPYLSVFCKISGQGGNALYGRPAAE
jgi:hypothetical protein